MIYRMTLKDSTDEMTFDLLEVPIVDKDIEGAVDNTTLDGNVYTDYLWLKKQWAQSWSILCDDEYTRLRGFYTRQFDNGEIPSYRLFYGSDSFNPFLLEGSYMQANVKGIEPAPLTLQTIYGNAEQNGTPTPDAPIAINTVTGEQTITVTNGSDSQSQEINLGKNLLLCEQNDSAQSGITWNVTGNTISGSGTVTGTWAYITKKTACKLPSGSYTLSFAEALPNSYRLQIIFSNADGTNTSRTILANGTSITYDATQTIVGYRLAITGFTANTSIDVTVKDVQLELGLATSFAPYFTPIELAGVGEITDGHYEYEDSIKRDNSTGKWYIEKQVGKVVYTGTSSESWVYVGGGHARFTINNSETALGGGEGSVPVVLSDHFIATDVSTMYAGLNLSIASHNSVHQFWVKYDAITSAEDFKTWLTTHPTTVYYALATPTTTEITDETLLEQLEHIYSLKLGLNNIFIESVGLTAEVLMRYTEILDRETELTPETPVRLTLTDDGVINTCGCRRNVQLTMRETRE